MADGRVIIDIDGNSSGFQTELSGIESVVLNTASAFKGAMIGIGGEVASAAKEAVIGTAEAGILFESAFTGVQKTVDATEEELAVLREGIRDLAGEIPTTTTEISAVAEAAGQLGIAKDDILDFTRVMIDLGNATNLTSGDAASALAKFANITQMDSSAYEALGSTIVDLGNNFATTEADIVAMSQRIASTGEVVGLQEYEILALATALSSLGIEAEAGGTAASTMLKKMETAVSLYGTAKDTIAATGYELRDLELMESNNSAGFKKLADSVGLTADELSAYVSNAKKLEGYAEIAGMDSDSFIEGWNSDTLGTLERFVVGLGEADNAIELLSGLGITAIRESNAVLALSTSGDLLQRTAKKAADAWKSNTALAKEAEQRYATAESRLQIFRNLLEEFKLDAYDQFSDEFGGVLDLIIDKVGTLNDALDEGGLQGLWDALIQETKELPGEIGRILFGETFSFDAGDRGGGGGRCHRKGVVRRCGVFGSVHHGGEPHIDRRYHFRRDRGRNIGCSY